MNNRSLESLIADACKALAQTCKKQINHREEQIQRSPLAGVFFALGFGYLLQRLPLIRIFANLLRFILSLIKPTVIIYGVIKVFTCLQQKGEAETKMKLAPRE